MRAGRNNGSKQVMNGYANAERRILFGLKPQMDCGMIEAFEGEWQYQNKSGWATSIWESKGSFTDGTESFDHYGDLS